MVTKKVQKWNETFCPSYQSYCWSFSWLNLFKLYWWRWKDTVQPELLFEKEIEIEEVVHQPQVALQDRNLFVFSYAQDMKAWGTDDDQCNIIWLKDYRMTRIISQ